MDEIAPRKRRTRRLNYEGIDTSKLTSLLARKAEAPKLTSKQRLAKEMQPAVDASRRQGYSWDEIAADFAKAGLKIKGSELRALFKEA